MVNYRWLLSGSILALAIFASADARALAPYVPEEASGKQASCYRVSDSEHHQVGAFSLAAVASDKTSGQTCSLGKTYESHAKNCPLIATGNAILAPVSIAVSTVGGVANVLGDQPRLIGAALNDAYMTLRMPYHYGELAN